MCLVIISGRFPNFPFRCEMEEQVLGEIDGDFTGGDCESHHSQVTSVLMLLIGITNARGAAIL